ncbi:hypothetical protein LQK93_02044 [Terrabacter sp. BE26]
MVSRLSIQQPRPIRQQPKSTVAHHVGVLVEAGILRVLPEPD